MGTVSVKVGALVCAERTYNYDHSNRALRIRSTYVHGFKDSPLVNYDPGHR